MSSLPAARPAQQKEKERTGHDLCDESASASSADSKQNVGSLAAVPKGKGRKLCVTCGKYFLCFQARAAHDLLAHGLDASRPEFGEKPITKEWALTYLEESEKEAEQVRHAEKCGSNCLKQLR